MLKAQKKLTRRQIKEDKFVTYYFKSQEYLKQNSRSILYVMGAFVLVLVAFFIYSRKQLEKEQNAIVELTKAKIEYFENDYAAAVPILKNLTEMYGGTTSAQEGTYYLANSYFHQKNYVEAERYFEMFLEANGDDILKASALAGVASCMEEQKNYSGAAEIYREAAEKYSDGFMAPENLFNSARCYALSGDDEEARLVLNEILEKYSNSNVKNDAEIMLAELSS